MRVIAKKHLVDYWTRHPDAESSLRAWYDEAVDASWTSPHDIRDQYAHASFVANNRVVFNIKGNAHRLIVAVAYKFSAVYIKFIGTHKAYDKVDAATIEMD
jgi:mRNA interferase HigB